MSLLFGFDMEALCSAIFSGIDANYVEEEVVESNER